jgi:hypothetical protein
MNEVVASAKMNISTAATPMIVTAPVRIVRAKRSPSAPSPWERSWRKIGMNGAASPASTSTSSRSSGSTNAALYASSSVPAPNVRAKMRSRTSPIT